MEYLLEEYYKLYNLLQESDLEKLQKTCIQYLKNIKPNYQHIFAIILDYLAYKRHEMNWKIFSLESKLFNQSAGKSFLEEKMQEAIEEQSIRNQLIYGMALTILSSQSKNLEIIKKHYPQKKTKLEIQVFFQPNYNIFSDYYFIYFLIIIACYLFLDTFYLLFHGIKSMIIVRGI